MFSKALRGSGKIFLLTFHGISCGSSKSESCRTDLSPEQRKESD